MTDLSNNSIPRGFRFGAVKAGLKASGRPDFALIVADRAASAAAAFTANRVIAAPLIVDKQNLGATRGKVRVVAINAGNANCAAGEAGMRAARATCEAAAKAFGCRARSVQELVVVGVVDLDGDACLLAHGDAGVVDEDGLTLEGAVGVGFLLSQWEPEGRFAWG